MIGCFLEMEGNKTEVTRDIISHHIQVTPVP
jgi:hypothetical protein